MAFLVTHLQVRLRLGGKRRNGLRTPSANRAVNACCALRIRSGRFSAFTAHRKAIGGPAVALLQPNCSTARLKSCQRSSGTQTAACTGRVRKALRRSWANQVHWTAIQLGSSRSSGRPAPDARRYRRGWTAAGGGCRWERRQTPVRSDAAAPSVSYLRPNNQPRKWQKHSGLRAHSAQEAECARRALCGARRISTAHIYTSCFPMALT